MQEPYLPSPAPFEPEPLVRRRTLIYILQGGLFVATFFTTTLAGVQWLNKDPYDLANFSSGLRYSLSLLAVLAAHEFGHYFAARYHRVAATLPYFIPVPYLPVNPFGTMGAVIRIKSLWPSKKALFDVGIAGPIAGFVVTLAVLLYGFATLPGKEYLYAIHPEYRLLAHIPATGFTFGNSLFFWTLTRLFAFHGFVPPMNEVYHYPYLCVGWFGLFVTALNLIPVGQLDGGHILYSLTGGKVQGAVARMFFIVLIVVGLASLIPFFGFGRYLGTMGWLLWALLLYFFVKLDHPPIPDDEPLSPNRRILGWTTFVIFVMTFPPVPFLE